MPQKKKKTKRELELELALAEAKNGRGIKDHAVRLAKSRTAWLSLVAGCFAALLAVDKGIPVVKRWGGIAIGWFISPEVEKMTKIKAAIDSVAVVPTKVATVEARVGINEAKVNLSFEKLNEFKEGLAEVHHKCLMEIRDVAVRHERDVRILQNALDDQRHMSYEIWADVRAMRGGPPPPTPEPVPTIAPISVTLPSSDS